MSSIGRNLILLFVVNFGVAFSVSAINPLFPLFLEDLGATVFETGLVLSVAGLFSAILMIPSGLLSDRYSRKRMITLSLFTAGLSVFLYNFAASWEQIIPWAMLFTGSSALFMTPRMALIADITKPETRATVYGVMNAAWPIGVISGPILGGFLADHHGWSYSFFLVTLVSLMCLAPALLINEERREKLERDEGKNREDQERLFDRKMIIALAIFFLFHVVGNTGRGVLIPILPKYLTETFHVSKTEVGLFFSIGFGVSTLIAQVPSGMLADRYGRKKIMVCCISTLPFFSLFWPWLNSYLLLIGLYMLTSGLWSTTWPTAMAYLVEITPKMKRGVTISIRQTAVRLGFTIGPLIGGYLWNAYDPTTPFYATAACFAAALLFAFLLKE